MSFVPSRTTVITVTDDNARVRTTFTDSVARPSTYNAPLAPEGTGANAGVADNTADYVALAPGFPGPPLVPETLPYLTFKGGGLVLPVLRTGFTPTGPRDGTVAVGVPGKMFKFYATVPDRARKVVEVTMLGAIRQHPPGVNAVGR